jgi:hypothetical protein
MNINKYKSLTSKQKQPNKQIEGQHQTQLGALLNGRLNPFLNPNLIFWTYSASGERKHLKTAVLQKRKGLQRGDFDYRFEIKDNNLLRLVYLETKTTKGALTLEQKQFKERKEGLINAKCYTSKSLEESLNILSKEGVLLNITL